MNTLRSLWVTCRPYLMFVSGAAALPGLALGRAPISRVLPAFVVLFLSYGLGQALTDVFQTDTDALSAPERPLVQGAIDKRTVLIASLGGLTACAAVIVWLSPAAALPAAIAIALLATYTPLKRHWWGGPPWNAAAVALLPLLGRMAGGTGLAEALADGAVCAAMVSSFGTYAVFVLLGYLKDVEADRATHYNTVAVRFGRRAAVLCSAACATLGLAASAWLVQPRLTDSAGTALWSVGAVILAGAHVLAWRSTSDDDAWPGIQASVHGFVAVHLGEAAAIEPRWTSMAWILFGASIVAMFRRPVRRQV
ncbi:MAG: UbiA family prenyltransferase [Steroidobacteraceae bacterium]